MNNVLLSKSNDPFFNLAFETVLFHEAKIQEGPKLYLWQNNDVVVIGRFQNPWKECNITKMDVDEVSLMRRDTGGGAVFHDIQNLCFTFVGDTTEPNYREKNSLLVCKALKKLGFDVEPSGRNDLVIEGLKISGAAFREKEGKYIHHGTLLIGTDLNRLASYLNPDKKKLESKGIQSVRARVTNLKALNEKVRIEEVINTLFETFLEEKSILEKEIQYIDNTYLNENIEVQREYDRLKSWDWIFGKSPEFTHSIEGRLDWGNIEIQLIVKHAVLEKLFVFSDALDTAFILNLENCLQNLIGLPYDMQVLKMQLEKNNYRDIASLC